MGFDGHIITDDFIIEPTLHDISVRVINTKKQKDAIFHGDLGEFVKVILKLIEENYPRNRELILTKIFDFGGRINYNSYDKKFMKLFELLYNIEIKIQNGDEQSEILADLEILDLEWEMLLRHGELQ